MKNLLWIVPIALFTNGCSHNTPAANAGSTASTEAPKVAEAAAPPSAPVEAETRPVVIARGTRLNVRINESLDTRTTKNGERFTATLTQPLSVNGGTILPTGTTFTGRVTTAAAS